MTFSSNPRGQKLDQLVILRWEMGLVGTGESQRGKFPRFKWERGWKDWPRVGSMQVREAGETWRLWWWRSMTDPLGGRRMWAKCQEGSSSVRWSPGLVTDRHCLSGKTRNWVTQRELLGWLMCLKMKVISSVSPVFHFYDCCSQTEVIFIMIVLVRILYECFGVKVSACCRLIRSHIAGDSCLCKALVALMFSAPG